MYSIVLDQQKNFECQIKLEGASLNTSKARLLMETNDLNLVFNGKIDDKGKVTIPINKLKSFLNENQRGTITLEVIADDVYFTPWSSDFEASLSRKVEVVMKEEIETPSKPRVSVVVENNEASHLDLLFDIIKENGININNIKNSSKKLNTIINGYISKHNLNESELIELMKNLPKKLYEDTPQ